MAIFGSSVSALISLIEKKNINAKIDKEKGAADFMISNAYIQFLFPIALLISSQNALADSPIDLIQISCIAESRFLRFEHVSLDARDVFLDAVGEDKKMKQRLSVWAKRGFYAPSHLRFECKLPDATYVITATQPEASERGYCGAAPDVTLSLTRNGEKYLDKVTFGTPCSGFQAVSSVTIFDGLPGWDARSMNLCMHPYGHEEHTEICKFLSETYSDITKAIPITQRVIQNYTEN